MTSCPLPDPKILDRWTPPTTSNESYAIYETLLCTVTSLSYKIRHRRQWGLRDRVLVRRDQIYIVRLHSVMQSVGRSVCCETNASVHVSVGRRSRS